MILVYKIILTLINKFSRKTKVKIEVKNMVCPRCVEAVKKTLGDLHIDFQKVNLGEIELDQHLSNQEKINLELSLKEKGFELLENKDTVLVNKIKSFIIEKIHYNKHASQFNISDDLEKLLAKDYSIISSTFRKSEGITLENFIIKQKIEKVKELISYGEMTMSESSLELNYSSLAHLSYQFKKIMSVSPSVYKKQKQKKRNSLDEL